MDASDIYLPRRNTIRNTPKAAPIVAGASTRREPRVVATPLPPLNPSHGLNTCPRTDATAARDAISTISGTAPRTSILTRYTGSAPLTASMIIPAIPAGLPQIRARLVAPEFPEPDIRISVPMSRPMIHDHGMEPERNASAMQPAPGQRFTFSAPSFCT